MLQKQGEVFHRILIFPVIEIKNRTILFSQSRPGAFFNELKANMDFTVDESYYMYLATSFNYRSDFLRIVSRLQELYTALTQWVHIIIRTESWNYQMFYQIGIKSL